MRRLVSLLCLGIALVSPLAQIVATTDARAYGVPLRTAISMYPPPGAEGSVALARVHALGARLLRIALPWSAVAPANPTPAFNAANPDDPAYRWREADRLIDGAVAAGLEPMIDISSPPSWAQQGSGALSPAPGQLALFAHAIATRYDGSRPGVPLVRYWEVWNEPNVSLFLSPQIVGGRVVSVETYRAMLNQFSAAVHSARAGDIVIGGELFPNGISRPQITAIAPLEFTRRLFCLSSGSRPHRVCNARVAVDEWSIHPYTSGGPSTRPANPNNVWIYNLGSLSTLVKAAQRLGTLTSSHRAQTWVTEFSWDSNPPDPRGVPVALEQRWVAEAIYRGWQAGVGVFTWFSLRDEPLGVSAFQSGLYYGCAAGIYCDSPKPAAASFRFPFVAFRSGTRCALVWGRTPGGARGKAAIQLRSAGRWRRLATLRTDGDGIFTARVRLPKGTSSRAVLRAVQLHGSASPGFSLHHPPDILVTPFGT